MTIGLYDIDLNHGTTFSISLPLMQAYTKFYKENHQVIMMRPTEKTGRFTKIFYFKENPNLAVPRHLVFNEKSSLHGYGFFKESRILEDTKKYEPSFFPYEACSSKIKNKTLFNSIKNNSLVEWREKNFGGYYSGRSIIYVNDRDFLQEDDWEDFFTQFNSNNIYIIHPVIAKDFGAAAQFLKYNTTGTELRVPFTLNKDELEFYSNYNGVSIEIKDKSESEIFLLFFTAKVLNLQIKPTYQYNPPTFISNLIKWNSNKEQISFMEFLGKDFNNFDYLKFPYRLLLKQNPKTYSYSDIPKT